MYCNMFGCCAKSLIVTLLTFPNSVTISDINCNKYVNKMFKMSTHQGPSSNLVCSVSVTHNYPLKSMNHTQVIRYSYI